MTFNAEGKATSVTGGVSLFCKYDMEMPNMIPPWWTLCDMLVASTKPVYSNVFREGLD